MQSERYHDRTVLITGAGSGIGRATTQRLAAEGARIVACDINLDGLAETLADLPDVHALQVDVADESSVTQVVADAVDHLGKLDVLVNVAGVLGFSRTHDETLAEWSRIITINLTGTFMMCRAALPHLVTSNGAIVNTASTAAHKGQAWAAAYCSSKGGVLALTRALAVEYAHHGVRVNSVSPGGIETPIVEAFKLPEGESFSLVKRSMPLAGFGKPDDVAAAIAYLGSPEAAYMNAADLVVDGGTIA